MHPFPPPVLLGRSTSPEAEALFARMSTPPTQYRRFLINQLINALKPDGTWASLDALYLAAAADSQAAALNWKSSSYNLTNNSAVFTADRGFKGDGAATYLTTGLSASLAQNSHSLGVWMNQGDTTGGVGIGYLVSGAVLFPIRSSNLQVWENSGSGVSQSVSDGLGYSAMTRTGSTGMTLQKNATQYAKTQASVSLGGGDYSLLAGFNGSAYDKFSDARLAAAFIAGTTALTTAQLTTLYNALNTYLTAVGGA